MHRVTKHNSNTFASVTAVKAVANVAVEMLRDAICGFHHALAHLLRYAGVAPEGLLGRPTGRLQAALVPAAPKSERNRAGHTGQSASWRRLPRPGTERRS